jgi:hypothetical protein
MTNVEMLGDLGWIDDVRQRMGAESEGDDSYDEAINKLSPKECCMKVAGWHLGDESWATMFINLYKDMEEMKVL